MFNSQAHRNFGHVVGASVAISAALWALPVQARVVSSQTIVSSGDSITALVTTSDGCIESSLVLTAGTSVSRSSGQPPIAGGHIFYTRYNECTGQYLAGIGDLFYVESGGISLNGDLRSGTAQFTTSATDQVSHAVLPITVDLTFFASGDLSHNHGQSIFYIDGVGYASQDSEWFQQASVTGSFSVGGVGGAIDASAQAASMSRGKSTTVIQTFGPPFRPFRQKKQLPPSVLSRPELA